jgi:hypothetical protein
VTELGRGVDPLELHLLESLAGSLGEERLAQGQDPLLDTRDRALDHDVVVVDLAVADETTQPAKSVCQQNLPFSTQARGKHTG